MSLSSNPSLIAPTGFPLSVIICTHNPYRDYLDQTLAGLRAQTLPVQEWELILVDNLSNPPLPDLARLDWHPQARTVIATELGLTQARLKGIETARADLIVFVDDDNILDPHYLERARDLGAARPYLGAWGAGLVLPKFEVEPSPEILPHTDTLSLRRQKEACWSNVRYVTECSPMGAGMCVRKTVAESWARTARASSLRQSLDRRGDSLGLCGDSDLALTACDLGLGNGVFPELEMVHLIPRKRCEEDFLVKNAYGWSYSVTLLDSLRRPNPRLGERRLLRWLKLRLRPFLLALFLPPLERKLRWARATGLYDALNQLDRDRVPH
jgi:glycosyltransferase involved in cell wall biosynthesis